MGKKKVVILDFDGTLYSSDHVFDKIDNFIVRHRREFLPNVTDEDYAKIVKDYPEWKKTFAATEIVEYLYLFKKKYPEMQITIKDFYDWQDAHPDPLVLDDVKIANQKFLKELCEEFPTYIVSNSPPNHIEHYMKKLNIEPEWFKKIYSNHFIARDRSKKHYYEEDSRNGKACTAQSIIHVVPIKFIHNDVVLETVFLDKDSSKGRDKQVKQQGECKAQTDKPQDLMGKLMSLSWFFSQHNTPVPMPF